MKKKFLIVVLVTLLTASILFGLTSGTTANAGTQSFVYPTEIKATSVNFINGSFQLPGTTGQIPMANVPGWSTYPVDPVYATTDPTRAFSIEIQAVTPSGTGGFATTQADGTRYAELNAYYLGRLYQDVTTVPGSRLLWQFAHRARRMGSNTSGTGVDVLKLSIREAGNPESTPDSSEEIITASSNALAWYYYKGVYTVPAGQTWTEFSYASVSSATGGAGSGNYLDDIKFQTGASLIAKKSISTAAADDDAAYIGEIVTITVDVTNWGETDASHCVFRDVLSDGLDYVDGSAKIDGADAGTLATFDGGTDELRINLGSGATAGTDKTNGGILGGAQTAGTAGTTGKGETITITFQAEVTGLIGDIVKNQASVTYNDYEFEGLSPAGYTQYTSVEGETPDVGDETTYVNQFTIGNEVSYTAPDADGGTTPSTVVAYLEGAPVTVSLDEPTRAGYTFEGWQSSVDSITYTGAQTFAMPSSDVVLSAQWTANDYTVTLDAGSGTGGTASVTATYDSAMPTATAPTLAGYTFSGYYTGADGTGDIYYNADMSSAADWDITSNTTLYAYWVANTDTVYKVEHYWQNAGDDNYMLHETENQTGTTDTTVMAAAKIYFGFTENTTHIDRVESGDIAGDGSLVLKLYYDRNTYSFTFDKNTTDTIADMPTMQTGIRYDGLASSPSSIPSRSGYTFGGWYKNTGCDVGNEWDFVTSTVKGDTIVYAKWTVDSQEFVYKYPDGSTSTEYHDTDEVFNLSDGTGFEKDGYTFDGWMIDGVFYAPGAEFTMPPEGVTAEPAYTADPQDFTYIYPDGTTVTEQHDTDETFNLSDGTGFEKDGYTQTGWMIDGVLYGLGAEYTMPPEGMTAEPVYEADPQDFTYTYPDGTTVTEQHGTDEVFNLSDGTGFEKDGYTQTGWMIDGVLYELGAEYTMPPEGMTAEPVYEADPQELTYMYPDGTTATEYHDTDEVFNLSDGTGFEKDGYTFDGWMIDGVFYAPGAEFTMPPEGVTVEPVYTADPQDFTYIYPDGTTVTEQHDTDETFNLSDGTGFEKDGYTQTGWMIDGVLYGLGAEYTMPPEGMTAEPVYEADPQELTYMYPDGTTATEYHDTDEVFNLSDGTGFEKDGYTQTGWMIDGVFYAPGAEFTMPPEGVTAEPVYTADPQDFTYIYPDGTTVTEQHDTDETFNLSDGTGFEKDGYTQTGWMIDGVFYELGAEYTMPPEGMTAEPVYEADPQDFIYTYPDGTTVTEQHGTDEVFNLSDGTGFEKDGYTQTGWMINGVIYELGAEYTMPPYGVTAEPIWIPDSNAVTYVKANGTTVVDSHETGETFNLRDGTGFTKTGYKITGWMIDGVFYELGEGYTMPPYGVTVEPVWEKNIQKITYDANGGEGGEGTFTESCQASSTFALDKGREFTREGYVIDGWTIKGTDYMLGELYVMPTYSVTAYAIWEIDSDGDGVSDKDEIAYGSDPENYDETPLIGNIDIIVLNEESLGIADLACVLNSSPEIVYTDNEGHTLYSNVVLAPHILTIREGELEELARFDLNFEKASVNSITYKGVTIYAKVSDNFQTVYIVITRNGDSWGITDTTISEMLEEEQEAELDTETDTESAVQKLLDAKDEADDVQADNETELDTKGGKSWLWWLLLIPALGLIWLILALWFRIIPVVERITDNGDDTFTIQWGYENRKLRKYEVDEEKSVLSVLEGSVISINGEVPYKFEKGSVEDVFTVVVNKDAVVQWKIKSRKEKVNVKEKI